MTSSVQPALVTLQAPMLFVGPYWHLTLPGTDIFLYYVICLAVVFWASGVAYMLSTTLPVNSVLVGTVFTCLIVGAFLSGTAPSIASVRGTAGEYLQAISYSRCASQPLPACLPGCGAMPAIPCTLIV